MIENKLQLNDGKTECLLMRPNKCTQNLIYHFYASPMYVLERIEKVQNSAARLIFQYRKKNHISPLLMSLYWLPINARIECELSVICHSFFLACFLNYLSDQLSVYTPKRNLHSSSDNRIQYIFLCSSHNMEFVAYRTLTY